MVQGLAVGVMPVPVVEVVKADSRSAGACFVYMVSVLIYL